MRCKPAAQVLEIGKIEAQLRRAVPGMMDRDARFQIARLRGIEVEKTVDAVQNNLRQQSIVGNLAERLDAGEKNQAGCDQNEEPSAPPHTPVFRVKVFGHALYGVGDSS